MADVLVLCYHAVSSEWRAALSVTPHALEQQIRFLVRRGYRGATLHDALTSESDERRLVVTFDDGFRSVLDLALPILSRLGLPATLFVVTDQVESEPRGWSGVDHWLGGPHRHELDLLTWSELRQLADVGWEIGSHTRSHVRLTELDDDDLEEELDGSRKRCEEMLGRPCRSLAYPYGMYDDRVIRAASAAGYEAAVTLPQRLDRVEPLAWPRIGVYHGDGRLAFAAKVSPTVRCLRATAVWPPLDAIRRCLKRIHTRPTQS
jgi:peptidoglycan/xylan/chitin deacetylase (PgdA/CDA1 family)